MGKLVVCIVICMTNAVLASDTAWKRDQPEQIYTCLASDTEGQLLDLQIQEFLVPAGPMLPAYNHEYYLQVRNAKTHQKVIFKLKYKSHFGSVINVYQGIRLNGTKTSYSVQHHMIHDTFTVQAGSGTTRYRCQTQHL